MVKYYSKERRELVYNFYNINGVNEQSKKFFFIFFFVFLGLGSVFKTTLASYKTFEYLKESTYKEKKLITMGLSNNQLIEKLLFDLNNSKIFSLGNTNREFLLSIAEEKVEFFSLQKEVILDVQKITEIDVWEFIEHSTTRTYGVDSFLLMAKSSFEKGKNEESFLFDSLTSLKSQIKNQKKNVKSTEKLFLLAVKSFDEEEREKTKQEFLLQSLVLSKMETDYAQKKEEYEILSPLLETLSQKIQGVEENRDALVKNVKTQKISGLFIGAVEESE